jgi:predicted RNase H-like HicB family nuclease
MEKGKTEAEIMQTIKDCLEELKELRRKRT